MVAKIEEMQERIIQNYIKANNISRLEGVEGEFLNQFGKRLKLEDLMNSKSFEGFRDGFEQNYNRYLNIAHFFETLVFESLSYKNLQTPLNYANNFFIKALEYNSGYLIGASYAFNPK